MKRAALTALLILTPFAGFCVTRPVGPVNFGILRYAAPNGSWTNDGITANSPWSLSYALAQAGPSTIITLLPGTYPSIEISRPGTKLVCRTKWAARVVGSPGVSGIWTDSNVGNVVIDGLEVVGSALDGIVLNGSNCIVRNCWVHNSSGSGISARLESGTLLERNLLETNAIGPLGGYGINLSGTNCIVRANVIRYNQGWGCQFYEAAPYSCAECDFYNNLVYANQNGLTVWSPAGQTNYVFNNTIVASTNYCVIADFGNLCVSNNILSAGSSSSLIGTADGANVWSDYNVFSANPLLSGPHDFVVADPAFVNAPSGLYWLTADSLARSIANPGVIPPVDFFGKLESLVSDVGAFQFSSALATDTRVLDPSPANGADYWASLAVVSNPPVITAQPSDQTVNVGGAATFTVNISGDAPLTYQWTFMGSAVGPNSSSYTRLGCQLADNGGSVSVTVSNASGSVQSSVATLTVIPNGTIYYVATNGSSSNNGLTPSTAWPEAYALGHAGASNTIVFLPGTNYSCIALTTPSIHNGLYLKSQTKWAARIIYNGTPTHNINIDSAVSNVVVDGFEVASSYYDGIKAGLGSTSITIRNCWIHDSGHGDPNWVPNSDGSYSGQGILAEESINLLIENNLIEHNGACARKDHGLYVSGTNGIVRNNVSRYNMALGLQLSSSYSGSGSSGMQFYNNLVYGNWPTPIDSGSGAVLFCGSDAGEYTLTNYFFGNTVVCANQAYAFIANYGCQTMLTNNIIISAGASPAALGENGAVIFADYNLTTNTLAGANVIVGSHNLVSTYPAIGFVNPANGLYWLTSGSTARNVAVSTACGSVDFFGNAQSSISDIGAFQYSAGGSSITRVLDPSPVNPDYWSPLR